MIFGPWTGEFLSYLFARSLARFLKLNPKLDLIFLLTKQMDTKLALTLVCIKWKLNLG